MEHKRTILALCLAATVGTLASCGDDNDDDNNNSGTTSPTTAGNPDPTPAPATTPTPVPTAWRSATLETECFDAAERRNLCVQGLVNFVVNSNGQYTIGPAGSSQITGALSEDELDQFNNIADSLAGQTLPTQAACENVTGLERGERVTLNIDGTNAPVIFLVDEATDQICVRGGRLQAEALSAGMMFLLTRYTLAAPAPSPSPTPAPTATPAPSPTPTPTPTATPSPSPVPEPNPSPSPSPEPQPSPDDDDDE